ncbi:MAG: efflux RND transporter permease subunit, partial [Moorella sp. (in: Bacteria)]|nr:efflux RND transporter permease subunit [Moorella sp. (in: firmicutes)]
MKITELSIQRPLLVAVVVIIVLLLGGVSLARMSVDLFPEMELPVGAVITSYPGVGPEEIEEQLTKPLESVLSTVSDLDTISSISRMGTSAVIVLFDWGKDMDFAALEMREKVDLIRRFLPEGAEDPMIIKMDPTQMPILQVAVSSADLVGLKQVCEDV